MIGRDARRGEAMTRHPRQSEKVVEEPGPRADELTDELLDRGDAPPLELHQLGSRVRTQVGHILPVEQADGSVVAPEGAPALRDGPPVPELKESVCRSVSRSICP